MPNKNQRSTTIPEDDYLLVEAIAKKTDRAVSNVFKLLIHESFGKGDEQKRAHKILREIRS